MRIESKHVSIAKPAAEFYDFLQDMNNFKELLPENKISEWKADLDECSFKVQGAATIGLKLNGGTPPTHIKMRSTDKAPFPFDLDVHLAEVDGVTDAHQVFEADINPMLKMMVEKPLKNLFDHIADKMAAIHGSSA